MKQRISRPHVFVIAAHNRLLYFIVSFFLSFSEQPLLLFLLLSVTFSLIILRVQDRYSTVIGFSPIHKAGTLFISFISFLWCIHRWFLLYIHISYLPASSMMMMMILCWMKRSLIIPFPFPWFLVRKPPITHLIILIFLVCCCCYFCFWWCNICIFRTRFFCVSVFLFDRRRLPIVLVLCLSLMMMSLITLGLFVSLRFLGFPLSLFF